MAQENKDSPLQYDLSSRMGHNNVHEQFSRTPNFCWPSTLPESKAIRFGGPKKQCCTARQVVLK